MTGPTRERDAMSWGKEDFLRRVSEAVAWSGLLLLMVRPSTAAATLVVFEDGEYERLEPARPEDADPIAVGPPAEESRSVRAFKESSSFSSPLASAFSPSSPYASQILAAAREHNVDPAFIAAVIKVESNGHAYAVSRKGARGLMQLMPATARRLGVRSAFDPRENIRGGVAYLAELAERFGETNADLILAAYNAGEHAVEEHGGVPPYRETRDYVRRVLALWGSPALARSAL